MCLAQQHPLAQQGKYFTYSSAVGQQKSTHSGLWNQLQVIRKAQSRNFFFLISQQYSAVTLTLRMILTKIILCAHAGKGQRNAHRVIYKNAIPNIQQIKGKLHFPPPLAVSLDPSIQFS